MTSNWSINKADPSYTEPTNLTGTKGQTLSTVALTSGWAWKDSSTVMNTTGSQSFAAIFIPDDTDNYNTVEKNLTVTVSEAPAEKTLSSIAVTTPPTKTEYTEGENFDADGMVVTSTYSDGSNDTVTSYSVTDGDNLTKGQTSVTISYTEGSVTRTATQNITVNAKSRPTPVIPTIGCERQHDHNGRAAVRRIAGRSND